MIFLLIRNIHRTCVPYLESDVIQNKVFLMATTKLPTNVNNVAHINRKKRTEHQMIVNLNLQDKKIVVVGGGEQAQRRIKGMLNQGCKIVVVSDAVNAPIKRWVDSKKIRLVKQKKVADAKPILKLKPDIVITTTNSKETNQKILKGAKKEMVMAYSSDDPDNSDFSNLAVIDFKGAVKVAIHTGGKSPIISKKIKERIEKALKDVITKEDVAHIRIQEMAREMAKKNIPIQKNRREYLCHISNNEKIEQLIKDGQIKKAEKEARVILENWR